MRRVSRCISPGKLKKHYLWRGARTRAARLLFRCARNKPGKIKFVIRARARDTFGGYNTRALHCRRARKKSRAKAGTPVNVYSAAKLFGPRAFAAFFAASRILSRRANTSEAREFASLLAAVIFLAGYGERTFARVNNCSEGCGEWEKIKFIPARVAGDFYRACGKCIFARLLTIIDIYRV